MESTLFGLPAHPLLVHAVVVLIPLAAIAMVVMVVAPRTREPPRLGHARAGGRRGGPDTVGGRVRRGARPPGRRDRRARTHEGLGENLTPFAVGLAVGAAALAAEHVRSERRSADFGHAARRRWVPIGVSALALVTAVAATAQVVAVGHSGAEATWEDATAEG